MNPTHSTWTWRFSDADGAAADTPSPTAGSRFDAEMWLGEHWRDLARSGVARAHLLRDGDAVGRPVEFLEYGLGAE